MSRLPVKDSRLAFYPGCLVLQRMPEYELATRAVLQALDTELDLVQEAACCGSPVVESFTAGWIHLAAYNLALIERMGHRRVVTVCGGCTNTLARASSALADPDLRQEANHRLGRLDLSVTGTVEVLHLLALLSGREEELRARVVRPLSLRVAFTNPCQVFRPGAVMAASGSIGPDSLRRLIELTGAQAIESGQEDGCCGATLYLADPGLALAVGRQRLLAAQTADVLLHACGNCRLLLHRFQRMIAGDEPGLHRQALLLPQLLGLAMGLPAQDLGLPEGAWR